MALITNININKNEIEFDLNNVSDIKISLANAIRRTIISEIDTYNIDDHAVTFFDNKSIFDSQFLIHRLKLIPIVSNLDLNYDDITITCHKENNDENIIGVYVSDFEFKNSNGTVIDVNTICKHPNILFAKLKHNDKISFEAKLTKNNSGNAGASFCPVSKCIYTFKIDNELAVGISKDMDESDKKSFFTQDVQRVYLKNMDGNPSVYSFGINSISFYEPYELISIGLEILINKINVLKTEFKNTNSEKVVLINDYEQNNFFVFSIHHENETIGNLLSSYINTYDNIDYCGYVIEHPSNKFFILKIKLNENNVLNNVLDIIDSNLNTIHTILTDILDSFNKEIKNK